MTTRLRYLALAVVALVIAVLFAYLEMRPGPAHIEAALELNGTSYPLMLADTEAERNRGLGGVEDLGPHAGMLFVLEDATGGGIWMKGMLIPLDILWLAEDGTVLKMEIGIEPSDPRIFTHDPSAWYVLEVPAGFVTEHGIGVGSKLEFSL